MFNKITYEKTLAGILLLLMMFSLFPIIYLGKYNHPTGDDYYYGVETYHEWQESGNVFNVLQKAAQGAALEYRQWQGTYSAMFLMYLPPNIWGDSAYHMVTAAILLLLTFSIFYFLKPIINNYFKGSVPMWLAVSALSVLLCVETVPSQGETFFWYNGAMYYTGFFSVSLVFLGIFLRLLYDLNSYDSNCVNHANTFHALNNSNKVRFVLLLILAVFLSGGNYISLLPLMIIMTLFTLFYIFKKKKNPALCSGIILLILIGAFAVNALAPGNSVRQSGMWKIPAWKAILKSLFQGVKYLCAWIDLWWLSAAVCLSPIFMKHYRKTDFEYRFPLLVTAIIYGIFCSMSCPLFYTMNSTGPARAVAIVYYAFILSTLFIYYYLLGSLYRYICRKDLITKFHGKSLIGIKIFMAVILVGILALQTVNGALMKTTTVKAVILISNGEAKAYDEEYQKRMLIFKDPSILNVELTPYIHQPDMLYVGDFSGDTEDPTNQKVAEYFNKESVFVHY